MNFRNNRSLLIGVGVQESLVLLTGQLKYFRALGYQVHLICSPGEVAQDFVKVEHAKLWPVPIARTIHPIADLFSFFRCFSVLIRIRPLIVNSGTPKAGLVVLLASMVTRSPARVYTLRGLRYESETGFIRWLLIQMERIACACSHKIICISPSVRQRALQDRLSTKSKLVVLGAGSSNGLDLSQFNATLELESAGRKFRDEHGIPSSGIIIGFLGRVIVRKGIEELVRAFISVAAQRTNAFLFIGGPLEEHQRPSPEILRVINEHPKIVALGYIKKPELFLSAIDIFALPAYWEGFGNVLIQAAAMGKPVLSTNATGCCDAVSDGFNGTLVTPKNIEAIESGLLRYIDDTEIRKKHGQNGLLWAQRFDQKVVWDNLHEFYQNLLKERFSSQ